MINTVNTKQQQLTNGYFIDGSGKELILIIGSCRSVPYLNYFSKWNEQNFNRFSIAFIDPFNWNYDLEDNRVNLEERINSLENDEIILSLLKSTTICIHEYYSNFGMFNFDKNAEKNIYQFGLNPEIDICIPNLNDRFIFFNDIIRFDSELRKKVMQDINVIGKLSEQTSGEIFYKGVQNLTKFFEVCKLSDIPEMVELFGSNFTKVRYFHNYNHVSKYFTLAIFEYINDKFLHLNLSKEFWEEISKQDMFGNSYTKLTEYDVKYYGFEWGEEIVPLSL